MNLPPALTQSPELLRHLFEASPHGVWILDRAGSTVALNPAMCRLLGRESGSLAGRSIYDLLQPEDARLLRQSLSGVDPGPEEAETPLTALDGNVHLCSRRLSPLRNAAGECDGWWMTWTDISAQRQAEQAMHRVGLAADAATDLISLVDETGVYRMVNDAWCRANRLSRKDVLGRHVHEIAPHQEIPERRDALMQCLTDRCPVSVKARVTLADRGLADLEIDYYPFGDDLHQTRQLMMMSRDVTAREAMFRAALVAEAEKRALLDAFPGYIAAIDQDLRYVYVNMATAARLGRRHGQVIGCTIDEVLGGETLENMRQDIARRFSQPGKPVTFERPYFSTNGLPPVNLQVTQVAGPVSLRGEQTFYTFGIDVSDYRRASRDVDILLKREWDRPQTV